MKRLLTLIGAIAALAAGVTVAVALGAGSSSLDTPTGTTTATTAPYITTVTLTATTAPDTATGTTTVTTAPDTAPETAPVTTTATTEPDNAAGTTTTVAAGATTNTLSSKVWFCHHTGSWKHPYHLIHISAHALPAHMNHGDVTPGAENSCPTTQPAGARAKTKHDNPGKGDDKTEADGD